METNTELFEAFIAGFNKTRARFVAEVYINYIFEKDKAKLEEVAKMDCIKQSLKTGFMLFQDFYITEINNMEDSDEFTLVLIYKLPKKHSLQVKLVIKCLIGSPAIVVTQLFSLVKNNKTLLEASHKQSLTMRELGEAVGKTL